MAKTSNHYPYEPDYAVCPGETLAETIESLGMSQKELALRTGLTSHMHSPINYRLDSDHGNIYQYSTDSNTLGCTSFAALQKQDGDHNEGAVYCNIGALDLGMCSI